MRQGLAGLRGLPRRVRMVRTSLGMRAETARSRRVVWRAILFVLWNQWMSDEYEICMP